jgi:NAD(P)-dependent dehydrogenase (short-subunit alcohol dehydrogenase family)
MCIVLHQFLFSYSMVKSLIIIGYGPGLSTALATRFGAEGYTLGLVSRTRHDDALTQLADAGITAHFEAADAGDIPTLQQALHRLSAKLGGVGAVVYNVAALKAADILQVTPEELVQEFGVNVAAALGSVQALLADLKKTGGTVLLTGGGLGTHPDPQYGSLSIGKAGLRSLAMQLHQRLQPEGIYVGLLTITRGIQAGDLTYSPAALAEHFWQLAQARTSPETTV